MSDHHHHHDHSGPIAIGATAARVVVGLLAGIGLLVVVGAIWLWPSHQHIDIPLPMQNGGGGAVQTEAGTVVMQDIGPCGSQSNGKVFDDTPLAPPAKSYECQRSMVSIDSGPHQGKHTLLEIAPGPGQPDLRAGDKIRIVRQNDPSGTPVYSFDDYSRGWPLALIGIAFAVVIAAVARWRGVRAVIGLVLAFGVLVVFLLPALLDGKPALPVALVAGALILYIVLYLAHGVNLRTSSALLGTLSAMVLAAALSWLTLKLTHVTGLSQEDNTNVATYVQHVSITGLLLAGFIIGSLGVLNDVTITQASAAFELAAIDEEATRREVFAAAMRVGRDHIASTVYTLVLAYAGGALPLLLMFSVAGRSMRDVLTGDAVAIEITRSAVGGICLALSVPLTTIIAVLLARPFSLRTEPVAPARRRSAAHAHRHADDDESASPRRRFPARAQEDEPYEEDEYDEHVGRRPGNYATRQAQARATADFGRDETGPRGPGARRIPQGGYEFEQPREGLPAHYAPEQPHQDPTHHVPEADQPDYSAQHYAGRHPDDGYSSQGDYTSNVNPYAGQQYDDYGHLDQSRHARYDPQVHHPGVSYPDQPPRHGRSEDRPEEQERPRHRYRRDWPPSDYDQ